MKLFMQGMRRSGTSIRFDTLAQDPRMSAWYEPLALLHPARLYGYLGLEPPATVLDWAAAHVSPTAKDTVADDPPWEEGYDRLGMREALAQAGYAP